MVKKEEVEDLKQEVEKVESNAVTVDKKVFDELIRRVGEVETKSNKAGVANEGYPLKVTKPDDVNTEDSKKYSAEDVQYFQRMSYYEGYPQIRAGRVEDTGKLYERDETYKSVLKGNSPICMCGKVKDLDSLKTTAVMFVPHRGAWICMSAQCEQAYYRRYGGFERLVSRHLFARDTPYYGLMLPDKNDPCTRRGIYPDTRMNEYNF